MFRRTGSILGSWELARDYELTDADGSRPDWGAYLAQILPTIGLLEPAKRHLAFRRHDESSEVVHRGRLPRSPSGATIPPSFLTGRPTLQLRAAAPQDRIDRMISYGRRLKYAFRTFFSILDHSRIPDDVVAAFVKTEASGTDRAEAPAVEVVPAAPDSTDRAIQMLALLQRDGRLIDFLMEDLAAYPDAQVGAAVRDIHTGCRQALDRYLSLQPVIDDEEGRPVTVERADPASIKVVGNVTGSPPLQGVLRHRGWEAARVELPPLPASGRTILAPAEVEVA